MAMGFCILRLASATDGPGLARMSSPLQLLQR